MDLIEEFLTGVQAVRGITTVRVNKLVFLLVSWRRFIGPYRESSISDIYQAIQGLRNGTNTRGRPFKQNTLHDPIVLLKRFYLWLIKNEYSAVPVARVQKIRAPPMDRQTKLPEQLLTKDEIFALIKAARNSRDRALVAVLYESGCRVGELGRLTWSRVQFDKHGVVITIDDRKCMKQRYAHITGQDIDNAVLAQYGIVPEEQKKGNALQPVTCPACQAISPPVASYCSSCDRPLNDEAVEAQDILEKDVLARPDLVKRLLSEVIDEKMKRGEL